MTDPMKRIHRSRLIVRFLVIVPLLWVVGPWHGLHHSDSESEGAHSHSGEAHVLEAHGSVSPHDEGEPSEATMTLLDGAPHCEGGPCVASIDTGSEAVQPIARQRHDSVRHRARGMLVRPLVRPPRST